jgi:hypothetical protein
MHGKCKIFFILGLLVTFITSFYGGTMADQPITFKKMKDVPDSAWKKLSEKKIYFGHMSVGFNIMAGVDDVLKENAKLKLSIVETNNPADFNRPLFAHSRVGKNHEPSSKIKGFSTFMNGGLGEKADIGFLKFCFVDIYAPTDVQKVFGEYRASMAELRKKYPQVTFVHVTAPLTTVQSGWKAFIKKIIGRPIDGYKDNIQRDSFNELLRKEYKGKEPIFDLAMFESTLPGGSRATFTKDGKEYPCLVPEYTKDGGHLNEKGRKFVAEQLLIFLATLSS